MSKPIHLPRLPRSRPRRPDQIAADFVRAHLGRAAFAPLTGTDTRAWYAFVHLVVLWGHTRDAVLIDAMRGVVSCAQVDHEAVMRVFLQTIPAMLDWSDAGVLWPLVSPAGAADFVPTHREG